VSGLPKRAYAQVVKETNATTGNITDYLYGDDLIKQTKAANDSYYLYDGLGSSRALSNNIGLISDTYDYSSFGKTLNQSGNTENSYLFTGEQYDAALDMTYLRARYYDHGSDRFTQMDTWMGDNQEPITLHKYLYTKADPVNNIDPSGNITIGQLVAASSVVGILASLSTSKYSIFESSAEHPDAGFVGTLDLGENPTVGNILVECIKEQYGDNSAIVRAIIEGASIPIYKPMLGAPVVGSSSRFTNFISAYGHFKYKGARLSFKFLGTTRAFGAAGRANAIAGSALFSYDITSIALCVNNHL
jgi:RHS repeat-associated protein